LSVTGTLTASTTALTMAIVQFRLAHQRRTAIAAGHLLGRTAHVDIDDVGVGVFVNIASRFHQRFLVTAENLQAERFFPFVHK